MTRNAIAMAGAVASDCNDLVRDPDDLILLDFVISDQRDCVIGQHGHRSLQPVHVVHGSIDQQIDVFRRPNEAVKDDRKAADQNVPNVFSALQSWRRSSSSGAREYSRSS
jgi:hypothetical protein